MGAVARIFRCRSREGRARRCRSSTVNKGGQGVEGGDERRGCEHSLLFYAGLGCEFCIMRGDVALPSAVPDEVSRPDGRRDARGRPSTPQSPRSMEPRRPRHRRDHRRRHFRHDRHGRRGRRAASGRRTGADDLVRSHRGCVRIHRALLRRVRVNGSGLRDRHTRIRTRHSASWWRGSSAGI